MYMACQAIRENLSPRFFTFFFSLEINENYFFRTRDNSNFWLKRQRQEQAQFPERQVNQKLATGINILKQRSLRYIIQPGTDPKLYTLVSANIFTLLETSLIN